jgi:signal transduction histidine kinase/DNA-binding response OmpR family regulator/CHASE3 domain sensor protein
MKASTAASTSAVSIEKRLALSALAVLLVLGAMCTIIYWNSIRFQDATNWAEHTHRVLFNLRGVANAFETSISEHRGYLISGDEAFRIRRDVALSNAREELIVLQGLLQDNLEQRARVARLAEYLGTYEKRMQAVTVSPDSAGIRQSFNGDNAIRFKDELARLLGEMRHTEESLLADRTEQAQQQYRLVNGLVAALIAGLVLLVAAVSARVSGDLRQRRVMEEALERRRRFDLTQNEALSLFNSTTDRKEVIDGLLALLTNNHPFPTAVFYRYEEWEGALVCESSRGNSPQLAQRCEQSASLPGQALTDRKTLLLHEAPGFTLVSGVAEFAPAAVLMVPVAYLDRPLGVLALAASRALDDTDVGFVERTCGQLGVALHNTGQYDAMRILSAQLRLRNEEVALKNEELEHASRMKSEFLANMSHELRTPLNAILGFSEVMYDGVLGELTEEQMNIIKDINDSGRHLLSLIDDILDLSKIEAGHMAVDPELIDLAGLLNNSLTIVRERASNNHVTLKADISPEIDKAVLDERRVKQIVYNLLSNAVKFTREGGQVTLSAHIRKPEEINTVPAPGYRVLPLLPPLRERYVEISVADTGIGIESKSLEELFQPFTQLDSDLSRRYAGTGLGLSLVLRLARLHGGSVAVQSAPGHGSHFTVWLPILHHDEANVLSVPRPSPVLPDGRQVLVIEDDQKAADLIRRQLEEAGFIVSNAVTAEDALSMARATPPALITLDILLPGIDGWEFLGQLKSEPALAGIPVVIVSVAADNKRGISLGAAGILQKPIGRTELIDTIEALGFSASDRRSRVLVVDDDPKAVELLATQLESSQRFEVLRSYGGQEGLQVAERDEPDLIILDLMMPGTNGFEVVESLKAQNRTRHIPVLIMTAKQLTAEDKRRLNGDVKSILYKADFNHGRFLNEVHRALREGGEGKH